MPTPARITKPEKPFRILKPGRYLTREGREATVTDFRHGDFFPAKGEIDHGITSWRLDGRQGNRRRGPRDLVSRLAPSRPRTPKRRTRGKGAQWGVWVPCTTRAQARACEVEVISRVTQRSGEAIVVTRRAK